MAPGVGVDARHQGLRPAAPREKHADRAGGSRRQTRETERSRRPTTDIPSAGLNGAIAEQEAVGGRLCECATGAVRRLGAVRGLTNVRAHAAVAVNSAQSAQVNQIRFKLSLPVPSKGAARTYTLYGTPVGQGEPSAAH